VAAYVLENSLVLLHPFMPFLTEYIYKLVTEEESIMLAQWKKVNCDFASEKGQLDEVIELISLIRNIRGEYNIAPSKELTAFVKTDRAEVKQSFEANKAMILNIARLEKIEMTDSTVDKAASNISTGFEVFIPLEGLVDFEAEIQKLNKELKKLEKDHNIFGGKLKNENYLANAKPEIIEKDKAKFAEIDEKLTKVKETIERLSGLC
jgi:valyl-tRNA synthetase